jgi:N-acetylgalactosamine-6-sulfatase
MNNWLDPRVPTLAGLLRQAGYATGHFGKWHLGSGDGAPPPADYGFDATRSVNSNGPGWDEPDNTFRAKSSAAIVDEALQFIADHRQRPFYVQLWTLVPHATLNPTAEQMEPYVGLRAGGRNFPHRSAAEIFYSSVTDLDAQIGRLLAGLEKLGVAGNTVVLFSSDNGPEDIHIRNAGHSGIGSAGPFRGRKRSLYEGGIRVPGLVRWPARIPAGRIDDTSILAAVDWLPTACKLAGVSLPPGITLDGEDMSDVLQGGSRTRRTPLLWEWRFRIAGEPFHQSPMLAIREGNWKLLLNPDRTRMELYDLERDPTQLDNVADRHADVVARLGEQVLAWHKELPPGPTDPGAGRNSYRWPGR